MPVCARVRTSIRYLLGERWCEIMVRTIEQKIGLLVEFGFGMFLISLILFLIAGAWAITHWYYTVCGGQTSHTVFPYGLVTSSVGVVVDTIHPLSGALSPVIYRFVVVQWFPILAMGDGTSCFSELIYRIGGVEKYANITAREGQTSRTVSPYVKRGVHHTWIVVARGSNPLYYLSQTGRKED